jgi:hypothetical protein
MKRRAANCPACGGPVEFQLSTALVTVCDFCHSVIARGDKELKDHGKVADLVDTDSPIARGQTGKFEKKSFEVVGRVQYQHPAGGVWDEWYLRFPNDRVRWLANAQGKFYLTTEKRVSEATSLPDYEVLSPGHRFELPGGTTLTVAEKGIATARSAAGDIPWSFQPNSKHRFVDLHGPGDEFATIEYDDAAAPRLFLGRELLLEELGLKGETWDVAAAHPSLTSALHINCPQCGGPLTLHAPDQTLRVCCPSCKALLDCQQGKLQYLQTLTMKCKEKILIPLGSVGTIEQTEYTVIGFVERCVVSDGVTYRWSEYLLSNAQAGFRWLVCSRGHWSFVCPIPVSSVMNRGNTVEFQGVSYRLFDRGTAFVSYVAGEFYWRVTVGEQVESSDYIAPPRMVSLEQTTTESGEELNISLGTYVDKEILESAFHVKELPAAWGAGAIQPLPSRSDVWWMWLGFCGLLLLLDAMFMAGAASRPFSQIHFFVALGAVSAWPLVMLFSRNQFEVSRWQNSDFSPYESGNSDE